MYTIEEIQNADFDKVMRGYKPEDVHTMLSQLAAQLETAEKEKKDMEKKLYILAQKVEEYRSEEDMLKTAMLNAQRMGESVIHEAKQKAESIVREADLKANLLDEQAKDKATKAESEYLELQRKISQFKSEVLDIYRQHIESLSSLPVDKVSEDEDEDEDMQIVLAEPIEQLAEEPVDTPVDEDIIEPIIADFNDDPLPFIKPQPNDTNIGIDEMNDTFDFGKASDDIAADVAQVKAHIAAEPQEDIKPYTAKSPQDKLNAQSTSTLQEAAQPPAESIFSQYDKIDFND